MGDALIAADIIDGVKSALADVGESITLSIMPAPIVDENNPGADPSQVPDDISIEAFLYNFDEQYMPGSSVEQGELLGIVDLSTLTTVQISTISIGNYLASSSKTYRISNINPIVVSGITVTIILQLEA